MGINEYSVQHSLSSFLFRETHIWQGERDITASNLDRMMICYMLLTLVEKRDIEQTSSSVSRVLQVQNILNAPCSPSGLYLKSGRYDH